MKIRWSKGMAVDLLLILLAGGIAYGARHFPRPEGSFSGPGSFPFVLGFFLMGLAVLSLWQKRQTAAPADPVSAKNPRLLIQAGLVAAYLFAMPHVGFILSSALLGALMLVSSGYRNYVRALAAGFAFAFLLYFIFGVLMNVLLPKGWVS